MDDRRSFAALFAAIGVLTLLGGAFFAYTQASFMSRCQEAKGTVIDLLWKTVSDEEGTTEYCYPIIEFKDVRTGLVATAQGSVGSNPPEFRVGDIIEVLYDPGEPGIVYVDNFWDVWMGPLIALCLGSAFILVALFIRKYAWSDVKAD